jgi:ATP-dependent Clp protease adapter protein ClpS
VWQTLLYNCDCHEYWEVVEQIMLAIKCTEATASQYTVTAHHLGSVVVFKGDKEKCEQVADVLGSIGLKVKVVQ